ncbi:MAG: MraY family glycosyltransferase [Elusimicrobia bacterium]|nr:MraY family glycosyltransferase [Elusimicrobiota bacterium]
MSKYPYSLYFLALGISFFMSFFLVPLFRLIALKLKVLDMPHSQVKTHKEPIPYLGGLPIWIGWIVSLFIIRFTTFFPTGTLHSLRGIILGSILILILGLADDIIPKGLGFKSKLLVQTLAALIVILFDIRLHFINPNFIAIIVSVIWIIGITNSLNIIDIMDGLSSGIAFIACMAFLFIALPTEQIYVNFCAAALAGGILGFIPYNLSKGKKIFMGDTGSLTIGFILASISLGTSYTKVNYIGLFAPLLILAIPIYDTFLVMVLRWSKSISPFMGSKDHFALRLEKIGFSRKQILLITYFASIILSLSAFLITRLSTEYATYIFIFIVLLAIITAYRLSQVKMEEKGK